MFSVTLRSISTRRVFPALRLLSIQTTVIPPKPIKTLTSHQIPRSHIMTTPSPDAKKAKVTGDKMFASKR